MTDDQIRERCVDICSQLYAVDQKQPPNGASTDWDNLWMAILESLCREMVAEGLERAAVEMVNSGNDKLNGWIEWCRQEAQRVKEGV